jgi:hypothetical protein
MEQALLLTIVQRKHLRVQARVFRYLPPVEHLLFLRVLLLFALVFGVRVVAHCGFIVAVLVDTLNHLLQVLRPEVLSQ